MRAGASTSRLRPWIAGTLSLSLLAANLPARAQQPSQPGPSAPQQSDEERAAARAAATEGVQLLEQGRYAEALDRLRRAEALVHAPTHLLYIARAQVKLGLLVEASETYVKIGRETLPPDAPRAFVEAQQSAAVEGKELDSRIPTLLIRVEGAGAREATVTMDGTPLPAAMIGLAAPVNPGVRVLRALAKDGTSVEARVKLGPGAHETAVLVLRAPSPPSAGPTPGAPGLPPPNPPPTAEEGEPTTHGPELGRMLGWAALGLGIAGLGVGAGFVVINRSKRSDANDLCPGGLCPLADKNQIQSLDQQADTAATVSWVAFGVGGAALVTGIVLLLTSSGAKKNGVSRGWHPWVGAGSGGVTGEF
jgi:hypothetical protein